MYFKTEDLSVGYNGKSLISGIDINVERGKIVTLIGPNGAGKSTILKTITNHLKRIDGAVCIDNNDIKNWTGKQLAKQLSVMLTDRIDPEMMTCSQVVAMGRYPYTNFFGSPTPEDVEIINESLEMVHALDLADRAFTDISDGQRQRIMLARAICQQPNVLVLDEPTSFLDIRHKIELLDILRDMARSKNVAVVLSLHEIDLAQKISDYVVCIKGDRIAIQGKPEDVFKDEMVTELYGIVKGSFNSLFGSVELPAPAGKPQVFILAGNGHGTPAYRILQKRGIPFITGVVYENDVDYHVAKKLTNQIIVTPAFEEVDPISIDLAKRAIDEVEYVWDVGTEIATYNSFNNELLDYARSKNKKVIKSDSEIEEN